MFTTLTYREILQQERRRLWEANDCHVPAGSPAGGQFCSKGRAGKRPASNITYWAPKGKRRTPTSTRGILQQILSMTAQRVVHATR